MNKKFSKAKILLLSLVFSILLPSLSVFADPAIATWGTHGNGFKNNGRFDIFFNVTPTHKNVATDSNKKAYYEIHDIYGRDINSYIEKNPSLSFIEGGSINLKKFVDMIMNIVKNKPSVTVMGTVLVQMNHSTPGVEVTEKDGQPTSIELLHTSIAREDFELPKNLKLYTGANDTRAFHIAYSNPTKELKGGTEDIICVEFTTGPMEDMWPDKNYILELEYDNQYLSSSEKGKLIRVSEPEPEPEPEKKPEPPTRIPETGPRSGGGFSFYNNAGDAAKKPQIDPNFVKIIAVDADTLRVLGISNSYLPRKGDIPVLAYALYEREVANGNLTGYKYKNLLAISEVKAENSLGELFKKHKADYIILLTH